MSRKIISLVLSICFLFQQTGLVQAAAVELNLSSYFARMSSGMSVDSFRPVHLRYFSYDSLNNSFKVLLDKGTFPKGTPSESQLKDQAKELLKYFLIGVTLPNDKFWVNLRPDSPTNIIDFNLEETDIGKIMLEADLQLKKDTALFTSPQTPEGREYWDKLYKKASELYGNENITIPTLTRPWIVPNEIIVRETKDSAYIYKATLKVMLESDYLSQSDYLRDGSQNKANLSPGIYEFKDSRAKALNEYSSQLIRELIIPKLTKEVNLSKRYAPLRQVYYSLILSRWFKSRFYGKSGIYPSLIDKNDLTNLTSKTTWDKSTYFNAYKKSFAEGEYNIQEPHYTPTGQTIRSYFSGGMDLTGKASSPMVLNGSKLIGSANDFAGILSRRGWLSAGVKVIAGEPIDVTFIRPQLQADMAERQTDALKTVAHNEEGPLVKSGLGRIETTEGDAAHTIQGAASPLGASSAVDVNSIVNKFESAFANWKGRVVGFFTEEDARQTERIAAELREMKDGFDSSSMDPQGRINWSKDFLEKEVIWRLSKQSQAKSAGEIMKPFSATVINHPISKGLVKATEDSIKELTAGQMKASSAVELKIGDEVILNRNSGYQIKITGELGPYWIARVTLPSGNDSPYTYHIPKHNLQELKEDDSDLSEHDLLNKLAIWQVRNPSAASPLTQEIILKTPADLSKELGNFNPLSLSSITEQNKLTKILDDLIAELHAKEGASIATENGDVRLEQLATIKSALERIEVIVNAMQEEREDTLRLRHGPQLAYSSFINFLTVSINKVNKALGETRRPSVEAAGRALTASPAQASSAVALMHPVEFLNKIYALVEKSRGDMSQRDAWRLLKENINDAELNIMEINFLNNIFHPAISSDKPVWMNAEDNHIIRVVWEKIWAYEDKIIRLASSDNDFISIDPSEAAQWIAGRDFYYNMVKGKIAMGQTTLDAARKMSACFKENGIEEEAARKYLSKFITLKERQRGYIYVLTPLSDIVEIKHLSGRSSSSPIDINIMRELLDANGDSSMNENGSASSAGEQGAASPVVEQIIGKLKDKIAQVKDEPFGMKNLLEVLIQGIEIRMEGFSDEDMVKFLEFYIRAEEEVFKRYPEPGNDPAEFEYLQRKFEELCSTLKDGNKVKELGPSIVVNFARTAYTWQLREHMLSRTRYRLSDPSPKELFPRRLILFRVLREALNELNLLADSLSAPVAAPEGASSAIVKHPTDRIISHISARADSDYSTEDLLKREFPGIDNKTRSGIAMILKDSTRSELPYNPEVRRRLKEYLDEDTTSSPVENLHLGGTDTSLRSVSIPDGKVGGIDFKHQAMAGATTYEAMGSFAGLDFSLPKLSSTALLSFNLDKEQADISQAIDNGIVVSGQRIKEFMAASNAKGQLEERRETVITWLAKLGILEETTCCTQESSKEYREALVIADSA